MRAALLALTLAFAAIASAQASDMHYSNLPPPVGPTIILYGSITQDDVDHFDALLKSDPAPINIILSSNGGSIGAAVKIGDAIAAHKMRTTVGPTATCASACGLIWLAGKPRVLYEGAQIGFHAAFTQHDGVAAASGPGNAVVGAYLGRLGLSDQAIVYLTSAPPDVVTWLTPVDQQRYGIASVDGYTITKNRETLAEVRAAQERSLRGVLVLKGLLTGRAPPE